MKTYLRARMHARASARQLGVAGCATIAILHEKWGERPLAYVVLKLDYKAKVTEEEIRKFCEGKMPKWQIPDAVLFLDSMPMTGAGKKNKKLLRAEKVWERATTKLKGQQNS